MGQTGAPSRLIAVLGDPVAHSISPAIQNAAISALGLDAVYVALRVPVAELKAVIHVLEVVGGAANLTVPLKLEAAHIVARRTPVADELGAVNTVWCGDDGAMVGDNTDAGGLLQVLDEMVAPPPWLLVGTGGSARAVAWAARERGAVLLVQSRDEGRADAFCEWARGLGARAELDDGAASIGTAINATPVGLDGSGKRPLPRERVEGAAVALDLVYAPGETAWVRECRGQGLRAMDGRALLVAQGALSFERFFPEQRAPREVMAAAVRRALAQ